MENPPKDIYKVFNLIDSIRSPELQKAAIEKYFLPDAGFKYPVFQVEEGPNSRDRILKLYQWLHIVSPKTRGVITHVVYDKIQNVILLDVTQHLNLVYMPFWSSTSRMLTRITLKRQGGLHYIAAQEDLMHPDDVAGLLLPPFKTLIRAALLWSAIILSLLSVIAQWMGIFAIRKGKEEELKARRKRSKKSKNGNGMRFPCP
ncbi:hypothetical protein DFP72DRAFT_816177 [Ephemerocybe angulata]|uniref:SigF-like NTF2-like domain-containing protein n=1 Tax=Ephemerocybe angulata TaxID=980116 RepID=A0A8H6M276_9AGAR|nr:hypothetical protein DFP72DRAFT_816177 [Tulosesus angulatus]